MKRNVTIGLTSLLLLTLSLSQQPTFGQSQKGSIQQNKQVIDRFYAGVEAQNFGVINDVFATNAQQFIPYAPDGFPKRLDGSAAIYKQFSGLTAYFGSMKFIHRIIATEDPNFFFVKFQGDMALKGGGVSIRMSISACSGLKTEKSWNIPSTLTRLSWPRPFT